MKRKILNGIRCYLPIVIIEILVIGLTLFILGNENPFLSFVDSGACRTLSGDVVVTAVFVEDTESTWSDEEMANMKSVLAEGAENVLAHAEDYEVELSIDFIYHKVSLDTNAEWKGEWHQDVLKRLGFPIPPLASMQIASEHEAKEAPIVFLLNKNDRSYAIQRRAVYTEYFVMYQGSASTFAHELYHLFGAEDYYYPDTVKNAADQYLPDSIMNSGSKVDSFTAYAIGWTDELDENADLFLKTVEDINERERARDHAIETVTGFATRSNQHGTYTGEWLHGLHHGYGTLNYEDGSTYAGNWNKGYYHGYGVRTYADGSSYEGYWINSAYHGDGYRVYPDGATYDGEWLNGLQNGYGTITYADGSTYTGNWDKGYYYGYGVRTYADGSSYEGYWINSAYHGDGYRVHPDGATYKGAFEDGRHHGYGICHFADGGTYDGEWVNGAFQGSGTYTFKNGITYTGEWLNGKYHGYGVYTFEDGGTYEGGFQNSKCHGYGVRTYADGTVRRGEWICGVYQGG